MALIKSTDLTLEEKIKNLDKGICGVYKIQSPTGKIYIGETICIRKRWMIYLSLQCKSQFRLYNSFLKHTVQTHLFEIIEVCSKEDLLCKERLWQDFYQVTGENGLNLKLSNCGDDKVEWSEESRDKMRGKNNPMYGKSGSLSPTFGRKHTEATKQLLSKQKSKPIINIVTKEIWEGAIQCAKLLGLNANGLNTALYRGLKNSIYKDFMWVCDYESLITNEKNQ